MKRKPVWQDLNPKAVTNDELFGYINPATREWKDGLLSSCMLYTWPTQRASVIEVHTSFQD